MIELLVVIAIIGLLSSIVLVSLNSARAKARDARRLSDMHQILLALEMYYDDNGQYPSMFSGPGSGKCSGITSAPSDWLSPYIPAIPIDPSGEGNLPDTYP